MKEVSKKELMNNCLQIFKQKYPTVALPWVGRMTKKEIADYTEKLIGSTGLRIKAQI
jgi:hypothetical protein